VKKIVFTAILIFAQVTFAQNKEINFDHLTSYGISSGNKIFIDNNFLAKSYTNNPPFCIDLRFYVHNNFGGGVYYRRNTAALKTKQYVGNSTHAVFKDWGFYACYFMQLEKKWLFIPKIGIATLNLKNQLHNDFDDSKYDYSTNGTTYFIAPEIHYFFHNNISVFSSLEYGFIDLSDVKASSALDTSYKSSVQLIMEAGVRFWL
jgi:hypothetical protein